MAIATDFPARGKITGTKDGMVIFNPSGTTYALHLDPRDGKYAGPVDRMISGLISVAAAKIYSVPSGGGFMSPILGPPRIVQGCVIFIGTDMIVVNAGAPILVDLPREDLALDLANGPIAVGAMVNVVTVGEASFVLQQAATAKSAL